jgi:2,3-bisphosphoglycerate-dependent phosphoglycerate mutase
VSKVSELILVRHGESEGNTAREAAEEAQADVIDVRQRDADVPLSALGREQALALGSGIGSISWDHAWTSPYVRAMQTAQLACPDVNFRVDERLRDRELGVLDRLTARGVRAHFPEEAERRRWLGKFYYRPPGGESWADVALRLRSVLGSPSRRRVLVFAHEAVIHLIRYVVEPVTVEEVLRFGRKPLANAGLTAWRRTDGGLRLVVADADVGVAEPATRQPHV